MLTQIKHSISHVLVAGLALLLVVLGSVVPAKSSELGHYAPALFRPRDFFVPPAGSYASLIQMYYTADTLRDKNGEKTKSIDVNGLTINIDSEVDSYMTIPTFIYVPETKLLGASYGFMVAPSFGNLSFSSKLPCGPKSPVSRLEAVGGRYIMHDLAHDREFAIRQLWLP